MAKTLTLFNGRWLGDNGKHAYAYIAAYSRADAVRVVTEYKGYEPRGMMSELKNYWNEGQWGTAMDGITPERGMWVEEEKYRSKPVKVYPK